MAFLWLEQRRRGEADIVDFGWTVSLGFLAVFYAIGGEGEKFSRSVIALVGAIWSLRLGLHLWKRVCSHGEDGRYVALRQHWGSRAQFNFFIFFQAQALLALFLSISFLIPATQIKDFNKIQILISLAWFLFSIGGETISDIQLKNWRNKPQNHGKTCRGGLWKYSRHPNYFFEWLYWFTYAILAYGSSYWFLTLISPCLILFLILKVTGIPPTEERALRTRGDDYRLYQKTTSSFVPWFSKR